MTGLRVGKRKRPSATSGGKQFRPKGKKQPRDKEVFKRRKYARNNYVVKKTEEKESDSSGDEEEEEEGGVYDQLLQAFKTGEGGPDEALVSEDEETEAEEEDRRVQGEDEQVLIDEDGPEADNDYSAVGDSTDTDDEEGEEEEEEDNSDEHDIENASDGDNNDDSDTLNDIDNDGKTNGRREASDHEDDAREDRLDPFAAHFEPVLDPEVVGRLQQQPAAGAAKCWHQVVDKLPELGRYQVQLLDVDQNQQQLSSSRLEAAADSSLEQHQARLMRQPPQKRFQLDQLFLKPKLLAHLQLPQNRFQLSPLFHELLGLFSSYRDVCWTERSHDNGEQLRLAYTAHALNHMLKTRAKILNNNTRHEKRGEADESLRDQGLVRPRILILVPFKESCRRVVEMMEQLLFPESKGNVANKKRFLEEFPRIITESKNKSEEFIQTFSGDINDSFKLGLAVTRKALKLYTDFYNSDIIIASPLGLRLVLGVEGEKERNYDFLNSIEVLIMDQTEIFTMQNWDHILSIFQDLHRQPAETHGVDFSRVRLWTLDGLNRFYRQSLIFSTYPCPEINAIFNQPNCSNYFGKIKVANPTVNGGICQVLSDVPLIFHRVETTSAKAALEDRFTYFTQKIVPTFMRDEMDHVLVFFSSYCDFVRVRNWFKSSNLDYAEISEYTKDSRMAKARDEFYHNGRHFLLYTERAHFYRRFRIKGARHLIFYQLPQSPVLFVDLCNLQQLSCQNPRGGSDANMSCTALYSRYDAVRLGLAVGSERAAVMLSAAKSKHVFAPGD